MNKKNSSQGIKQITKNKTATSKILFVVVLPSSNSLCRNMILYELVIPEIMTDTCMLVNKIYKECVYRIFKTIKNMHTIFSC